MPGAVPFAVSFESAGNLVVAEAGTNAVATFALAQTGPCAAPFGARPARRHLLGGDRGAVLLCLERRQRVTERLRVGAGRLAVAARCDLDRRRHRGCERNSRRARSSTSRPAPRAIVDEFRVSADGTLTSIGSVTVPDAAGGEGIVAL